MRRADTHWNDSEAAQLLANAETVHLAATNHSGAPILRALHAVHVGDLIAFHGAKAGERKLCLGREAVVSAERVLANIPSYFVDPERACPATTYYQSVQAHGTLVEVTDLAEKGRVVAALMRKYQPEGGYQPVDPASPLYVKALRGLLVYGVRIRELTGKFQTGQRRKGAELSAILDGLWDRGSARDLEAIDHIFSSRPNIEYSRMRGPGGTRLRCALGVADEARVVGLLSGSYWNKDATYAEVVASHRASAAWLGFEDQDGTLVASARAIGDSRRFGWILDFIVADEHQRRGIGNALMTRLLDHPLLRHCRSIGLVTRDARDFYEKFGFSRTGAHATTGYDQMLLREPLAPTG